MPPGCEKAYKWNIPSRHPPSPQCRCVPVHVTSGEATSERTKGGEGRHLLCTEPEPESKQNPLQVSTVQVATPVGIKEDEREKTIQREHSRGVQLLGLQEETRMNGVINCSLNG